MTVLAPLAVQRFVDNNGQPLVGGKLFTYQAGTTTKQATFTDSTGLVQNTNPVILNYRGEAQVWIDSALTYKFVLAPDDDTDPPANPFWSVDNIRAVGYTTQDAVLTLTGCTTAPTVTAKITKLGNFVAIYVPGVTAVSNSPACTLTGLPAAYRVSDARNGFALVVDASAAAAGAWSVGNTGTITLYVGANTGFNPAGTKGISGGLTMMYPLDT